MNTSQQKAPLERGHVRTARKDNMHTTSLVPNTQVRKGEMLRFAFSGHDVRVVMQQNDPWWVAVDVCGVLGIVNPRHAVSRLDPDERNCVALNDGKRGTPFRNIVSESGLYNLILRSEKPEAKGFKRWVSHEVLPTIRKTGSYQLNTRSMPQNYREALRELLAQVEQNEDQETIIREQDELITKQGQTIRDLNTRNMEQAKAISELEPKAEAFGVFYDALAESAKYLPPQMCKRLATLADRKGVA